jgi:hypothetical protein
MFVGKKYLHIINFYLSLYSEEFFVLISYQMRTQYFTDISLWKEYVAVEWVKKINFIWVLEDKAIIVFALTRVDVLKQLRWNGYNCCSRPNVTSSPQFQKNNILGKKRFKALKLNKHICDY